jgi:hypothetical protein
MIDASFIIINLKLLIRMSLKLRKGMKKVLEDKK